MNQKILLGLFLGTGIGLGYSVMAGNWPAAVQVAMTAATVYLGMEATRGILEQRKSRRIDFLRYSLENLYTPIINLVYKGSQDHEFKSISAAAEIDKLVTNYGYLLSGDLLAMWRKIRGKASAWESFASFIATLPNSDLFESIRVEYEKLKKEHQKLIEE